MSITATAAPRSPDGLRPPTDDLFVPRLPPHLLALSVEQALRDLRGSVSDEVLPEMAVLLARHRLLTPVTRR